LSITIQAKLKKRTAKNNTPNKKKLKNALKDRARCYGHVSARNRENGATVETKLISKDLCFKRKQKIISLIYFIWETNVRYI